MIDARRMHPEDWRWQEPYVPSRPTIAVIERAKDDEDAAQERAKHADRRYPFGFARVLGPLEDPPAAAPPVRELAWPVDP